MVKAIKKTTNQVDLKVTKAICKNKAYISEVKDDKIFKAARKLIKKETNSFYIMDLTSVKKRIQLWHKLLPNVGLHYAVKTNCDM